MFRYTDLHKAIQGNSLETVKHLVKDGANVELRDLHGATPICRAVELGSLEMVSYLVEHGANVNNEAVHTAVKIGSLEIVKYLVEHGADVNIEGYLKGTPLNTAVETGSIEIVRYFVEHGADVNHENILHSTPLHKAIQNGSLKIAKYLVEHGADVNCANDIVGTPLDLAAKMRSLEMVEYLFENNGKVTRVDGDTWSKILYLACELGKSSVVEYLLQREVVKEITKYFDSEWSPLRTACYHGHTAVVQTLLKYNVDIRKETKLECGNDEIISILSMELKKSLKHREKIQILQQMNEEKLVKVRLC